MFEHFVTYHEAVASVDEDMLRCVCNELDYRIDICPATKGCHIGDIYRLT
jgi:hypothetical protein